MAHTRKLAKELGDLQIKSVDEDCAIQQSESSSSSEVDQDSSDALSPTSETFDVHGTVLWVVYKTYLVHIGPDAAVEPPAVRSKVIGVFSRSDKARQVAKQTWNKTFAYSIPEGKTDEFDILDLSPVIGNRWSDGEMWRCVNREYVDEEDRTVYKQGEKAVRIYKMSVDASPPDEEKEGSDCREESP